MAEIHPAVELLIKRMKSNPEEFTEGRWNWVEQFERHYTKEDTEAFETEFRKIAMEELHKKVMKQILDPRPQQPDLFTAGPAKWNKQTKKAERTYG